MTTLTPEQIKELKALIDIGHYKPNLLTQYKNWFKIVFGKSYSGCNCAASTMYSQLKQYLDINKLK